MADLRRISEEYTRLAEDVIYENKELSYILVSDVTITYLASTHEKKKAEEVKEVKPVVEDVPKPQKQAETDPVQ